MFVVYYFDYGRFTKHRLITRDVEWWSTISRSVWMVPPPPGVWDT